MTIPDRLEQVLMELEARHCHTPRPEDPPYCPECSSVINNTLIEWPCRYAFLFAKLRAAMEMEKMGQALADHVHTEMDANCTHADRMLVALAAWRKAGEAK